MLRGWRKRTRQTAQTSARAWPRSASPPSPTRRGAPVYLVGGAVRDLLLGRAPEEIENLDLAVEGDAIELARRVSGGELREHERFGTATVEVGGREVDLARTRTETYARPGALPDVEAASLAEDLRRRDFAATRSRSRSRRRTSSSTHTRAGSTWSRGSCAPCTPRRSRTTRPAPCAPPATPPAWASTSRRRPRRSSATPTSRRSRPSASRPSSSACSARTNGGAASSCSPSGGLAPPPTWS